MFYFSWMELFPLLFLGQWDFNLHPRAGNTDQTIRGRQTKYPEKCPKTAGFF